MTSYTRSFADQIRVVIPGTEHRLGTPYFVFQVFGAPFPLYTIDCVSYDLTLNYTQPHTGTVVLIAPEVCVNDGAYQFNRSG